MMKPAAMFALLLLAASPPQESSDGKPPPCCDGKTPYPWAEYNKGVQWSQPAVETVERARRENRLIMFFQVVGDLDKEGC